MKKRLTGIVTKKGDDGTTVVTAGTRISKSHASVSFLGELDELNSFVGLLISEVENQELKKKLTTIQHDLFNFGAEISTNTSIIKEDSISRLEAQIKAFESELPELGGFILPGGSRAAATAHVCRAVSRRVERSLIQLEEQIGVNDPVRKQYINRLSDWFFMLARKLNDMAKVKETLWTKDRS